MKLKEIKLWFGGGDILGHYDRMFVEYISDILLGIKRANKNIKCISCGKLIDEIIFGFYEHNDGLLENSSGKRYWVYIKCPYCGYDIALWKLFDQIKPEDLGIMDIEEKNNRLIVMTIYHNEGKICVDDITLNKTLILPLSSDLNQIKDPKFIMNKGEIIEWEEVL